MKSLAPAIAFLVMFPFICRAENSKEDEDAYILYESERKAEAEKTIPQIVKQYATTIGCDFEMNPANVIPLKKDSFVVLFSLDVGCSGGNKMQRPVFAVVQHGAHFNMFINPDYSNPSQTPSQFPQQTTSIYSRAGKVFFKAKKTTDSSKIIEGELVFENGIWGSVQSRVAQPN